MLQNIKEDKPNYEFTEHFTSFKLNILLSSDIFFKMVKIYLKKTISKNISRIKSLVLKLYFR